MTRSTASNRVARRLVGSSTKNFVRNNTVDRFILWIAVSGVLSGLAMTIVIASVLRRNRFAIPWYDLLYFVSIDCAGLYALARFLNKKRKKPPERKSLAVIKTHLPVSRSKRRFCSGHNSKITLTIPLSVKRLPLESHLVCVSLDAGCRSTLVCMPAICAISPVTMFRMNTYRKRPRKGL